jgi:site-specific DNA-methyltransferase (adenine-specific)
MTLIEMASVGAILCDPPYGLSFMGKEWDRLDLRGSASRPATSETASSRAGRGMGHGIHAGKPALDLTPAANRAMQDWHVAWLAEAFRALQSGGTIKVFGGTRVFHRLAVAMHEVGFVDISVTAWTYGSGFPKSHNIPKAIDRHLGAVPVVVDTVPSRNPHAQATGWGNKGTDNWRDNKRGTQPMPVTEPGSSEARAWKGWGTALKPAWEPVLVGRKP